jgi:hypothetical protein
MTGDISKDRERCQLLDEKRDVVPGGSGGERSGGARNLLYLAARSNSDGVDDLTPRGGAGAFGIAARPWCRLMRNALDAVA